MFGGRRTGDRQSLRPAWLSSVENRDERAPLGRGRLTGVARVWILTALIALVSAVLYATVVASLPGPQSDLQLPWWLLAPLFYLAESHVVHIQLRGDAHSFSLSELPLVAGLFFATPTNLMVGLLVGSGLALLVSRRQSPLKLSFNLALFGLGTLTAIILWNSAIGGADPVGVAAWTATFEALVVSSLVGAGLILAAISLSEGLPPPRLRESVFISALGITATNTSLALAGVHILQTNPGAAWLLGVPAVAVFLAYRAYTGERHKREGLDFLYRSSRILHESREAEAGFTSVLSGVCEMFRAETAEIVLLPSVADQLALRTNVSRTSHHGPVDPYPQLPPGIADGLAHAPAAMDLAAAMKVPALAAYLGGRDVRNAMIAPLRGETGVTGMVLVLDRLGDVSTFDNEDLRLFEALTFNTAVAIESGRLEKSLARVSSLKEQLTHQASHDPLTGLANRVLFADRIEHALARRERTDPIAVLFLDLDDFKVINDSLGHEAGDRLLVAVARRLEACLREEDTAARLGGDEFGVLIEETSDPADAVEVAERIITAVRAPFSVVSTEVEVRATVGIAFSRPEDYRAGEILRNADVAMYRAKGLGKGRFAVFEDEMHTTVLNRLHLKSELQLALSRNEFILYYQPVVDLATRRLVSVEALIRWQHPRRGLVPPAEFIPLAEETGLILPITRWVLATAAHQLAAWHAEFPRHRGLSMAVNVSPRDLQQASFASEVRTAVQDAHLSPGSLMLELTENLVGDSDEALKALRELKELGVRLAIDDFGNGYSALHRLRQFPFDVVKIAKWFVDDLRPGGDAKFAGAVVALGGSIGLEIIAEGIEHPEQARRLGDLGCGLGQGYFFARPMTADDVRMLLAPSRTVEDVTL